jgi:hypothetical protein
MKQYGILGILIAVSALHPLSTRAAEPPRILISEINFAGSESSTADEWIELVNLENTPVDLSNWVMTGIGTSGGAISLATGTVIPSHGTLLIANYNVGDEKSTLTIAPQLVTSSVSIANSSLNIILAMPNGLVTDEYHDSGILDYGSTSPSTSIERNLTDKTWHSATENKNLSKVSQKGTPGVAIIPAVSIPITTEPAPVTETAPPAEVLPVVTEPVATAPAPCVCPAETTPIEEIIPPPTPQTTSIPATTPTISMPVVTPIATPVVTSTPTPVVTEVPKPVAFAKGALLINELLPDPMSGEEWLEIVNPGTQSINITGWIIKDASLKATPLPEQSLAPHAFLVIEKPGGSLNNTGDTVTLFDGADTVIDSVTYGKDAWPVPKKGEVLARKNSALWEITSPTKNAANVFPQLTSSVSETYDKTSDNTPTDLDHSGPPQETLGVNAGLPPETTEDGTYRIIAVAAPVKAEDESKNTSTTESTPAPEITAQSVTENTDELTEGTKVTVEGTVVAEPGLFGKQTAYVNGLELYFNKAAWPSMPAGTTIRVTGTVSKSDGNTRLKIAKASDIILSGEDLLAPTYVDDLSDAPHGELVQIQGTAQDKSGKIWMILLSNGETVTVTFAKNAKTDAEALKKGSIVNITGIVKRKGADITLVIRSAEDIEAVEMIPETMDVTPATITDTVAPPADKKLPWVGGGLITTSLGALTFWYTRAKGLSLLNIINP